MTKKILVVDDDKNNTELLKTILNINGFDVVAAGNGVDALKKLRDHNVDLIISDILMPVMDGFQFCREVRDIVKLKNIPFVFHTAAYTEKKDEELAYKLGVIRFIPKPVDPNEFINIIQGILESIKTGKLHYRKQELGKKKEDYRAYSERLVEKLEKKMITLEDEIAERKRAEHELKCSRGQLRQALKGTIKAIAKAIEARDPYTSGHQGRVAKLACSIAKQMALNENQTEGIYMGAMIHDIGKIQIPAEILSKPGILLETEYALVKSHPEVGYGILKDIDFPWPVAEIAYQHHEHIDGSGYPQGLKGNAILFEARIVCVADVVEAISGHRPYRPSIGIETALAEIEKNKNLIYDEGVVDAFLELYRQKKINFDE